MKEKIYKIEWINELKSKVRGEEDQVALDL